MAIRDEDGNIILTDYQIAGILAANTDTNTAMIYNESASRNKALSPNFTGADSRIVNAINISYAEAQNSKSIANSVYDQFADVILNLVSPSNQVIWEQCKQVTGKNSLIEAVLSLAQRLDAGVVTKEQIITLLGYTPVSMDQVPTKVSELTNDLNFATESFVNTAISTLSSLEMVIVEQLPQTGENGKIYLVAVTGADSSNKFNEYIWIQDKWETLGSSSLDLSDYYNKTEIDGKLDTINTSISTIEGGVNKNRTDITDLQTSLDTKANKTDLDTKQDKLTAGDNITIIDNTVSVQIPDMSAANVTYDNVDYPTVKEALDKLLYVNPVVSSFTCSVPTTNELGSTIQNITFNWVCNKTVKTQVFSDNAGLSTDLAPALRTHTIENIGLSSGRTYRITINDGTNSANRTLGINFVLRRYFGTSTKAQLEDSDILAFTDKDFTTNRKVTKTFNCSGGKYFYLVIPTSYCNGISFKVGGLAFSDMEVVTRSVTNSSGNTSSYNIYRPASIQTGSAISVEVV